MEKLPTREAWRNGDALLLPDALVYDALGVYQRPWILGRESLGVVCEFQAGAAMIGFPELVMIVVVLGIIWLVQKVRG